MIEEVDLEMPVMTLGYKSTALSSLSERVMDLVESLRREAEYFAVLQCLCLQVRELNSFLIVDFLLVLVLAVVFAIVGIFAYG